MIKQSTQRTYLRWWSLNNPLVKVFICGLAHGSKIARIWLGKSSLIWLVLNLSRAGSARLESEPSSACNEPDWLVC
ncbi:hypothetical protein HanXRQr2_Chr07g0306281 [Helianthus annuus]|uniref:Uncharacterized protein n=1 Tax=Helianthus annuus TaxID=4232 RepID=A0A251UCM6_HELAN|nr:hypothetical protein HanXRQr2_Chr07g0306281 [Helianthus annuus]KAJ0905658.1 hypothetical protein HanPSC8_Chr07g0296471 [Helianthus annuus]